MKHLPILILMTTVLALAPRTGRAQTSACTPFGNPPQTLIQDEVPLCTGGTVLQGWSDSDGTPRYACLFLPSAGVSPSAPLPLVIYLHPSLTTADNSESGTNLLEYLDSANLTDNSSRLGFILLAPEGRDTTHYYPVPDNSGPGWDNWYRQFTPGTVTAGGTAYPENVDAAAIDHFVAEVQARGIVDPNRIYATGWSNGAAMAYAWGLARPQIAAIAPYSAPDPYHAFNDPCPQTPVAGEPANISEIEIYNLGAPTYHIHNNCDIAGICPNGELLMHQLLPIGIFVQDTIIDSTTAPANGCLDACGTNPDGDASNELADTLGTTNHDRWPGNWVPGMLDFFRAHPLNSRPAEQ